MSWLASAGGRGGGQTQQQSHDSRNPQPRTPRHLPQPGHSRSHADDGIEILPDSIGFARQVRAGADQGHLAPQHIGQLGQLIQAEPPQDATGRDAFTVLNFELGRVLSSAPLIPALLTLRAISASPTLGDKAGWIERVCAGEFIPAGMLGSRIEAKIDEVLG